MILFMNWTSADLKLAKVRPIRPTVPEDEEFTSFRSVRNIWVPVVMLSYEIMCLGPTGIQHLQVDNT
jgi:hypothetical protein